MRSYIKHTYLFLLVLALVGVFLMPSLTATADQLEAVTPVSQVVLHDPVTLEIVTKEVSVQPAKAATPQVYHETIAEAAAELRAKLIAREDVITIGLHWNNADNALMSQILDEAFLHTGNPKEGDYLLRHYGGCTIQMGGRYSGSDYYLVFTYNIVRYYTTTQQEAEVDTAVAALLDQLDIWDSSDYEKVKAVYDYICSHVTYDHAGLSGTDFTTYSAWKALTQGTSVCQGYANLFYRLMLELDVDCRIISGTGNGGPHAWNIVKLNGLYYNVDATWDASRVEMNWDYDFFLRSPSNFTDHIRDAEFETAEFHAAYPMGEQDFNLSDMFTFEIQDGGVIITGYTGNDTEVGIPTHLAGYPVTQIGPKAFIRAGLTSVTFPDTITVIDELAFSGNGLLENFDFPTSLQTIGDSAFYSCRKLTSIHLPSGVKTVDISAFENCDALVDVSLPEGLTYIGFGAFRGCFNLTQITLPSSLTFLGGSVFEDCTALRQVNIPAGITAIKLDSFLECINLVSIDLPASVKTIEDSAFENCEKLETLDLSHVTSIGEDAFSGCVKLKGLNLSPQLTKLGPHAFFACHSITQAVVPAGITALEMGVFSNCYSLQSLTLPDNMTSIGHSAVSGCESLTSLTLPSKLTFIDATAFQSAAFTSIKIPEGVTQLPMFAFQSCVNLKTVTIPVSMQTIDLQAFHLCSGITTVYYNGTQQQWDAIEIAEFGNETLLSARLVLTSAEPVSGDMNGDHQLSDADALYLLRFTLFPARYPISIDADVNADGVVTDADALYLLRHTLFPARYPLYPAA